MACKKLLAEGIGTFGLVLGGVGAVSMMGGGAGVIGVAMAFGFALIAMGYALGPVSGGHFNPAVTVGMVIAKRFDGGDAIGYIIAQVIGGVLGAYVITHIAPDAKLLSNGFSAGGMESVFIAEAVLTALFVFIILGATERGSHGAMAPLAIGLTYALIHLISFGIDGTSVNPARSTATALLAQGEALDQLWLFWVAPIVGGAIGAFGYNHFGDCK